MAGLDRGRQGHDGSKKKHERDADIAAWYGIDATKLSGDAKVGLYANLGRVKAQKRIHEGSFDPTDYKGVYALYLAAFDDEQLASKAAANAAELLVEQRTAG